MCASRRASDDSVMAVRVPESVRLRGCFILLIASRTNQPIPLLVLSEIYAHFPRPHLALARGGGAGPVDFVSPVRRTFLPGPQPPLALNPIALQLSEWTRKVLIL